MLRLWGPVHLSRGGRDGHYLFDFFFHPGRWGVAALFLHGLMRSPHVPFLSVSVDKGAAPPALDELLRDWHRLSSSSVHHSCASTWNGGTLKAIFACSLVPAP